MEKKEEDKKKNRILIILFLLIIFLFMYIYLSKGWMGEEDVIETPVVEEDPIEQVDPVEIPVQSEPATEVAVPKEEKVDIIEEKEDVIEVVIDEEEVVGVEEEKEEEVEVEEVVTTPSNVKFGLTMAQRAEIWWKYQKRQTEIQEEAKKLNDDRFSKTYLGHVDKEINKLTYSLKKEYDLNTGELDYILEEGKDGKYNNMIQTF